MGCVLQEELNSALLAFSRGFLLALSAGLSKLIRLEAEAASCSAEGQMRSVSPHVGRCCLVVPTYHMGCCADTHVVVDVHAVCGCMFPILLNAHSGIQVQFLLCTLSCSYLCFRAPRKALLEGHEVFSCFLLVFSSLMV